MYRTPSAVLLSRLHEACMTKVGLCLSMCVSNVILCSEFTVNEGGIKQASNSCPDPGEPENGKRIGNDFR